MGRIYRHFTSQRLVILDSMNGCSGEKRFWTEEGIVLGMTRAVVRMSNHVLTDFPCYIECLQIF